MGNCNIPTKSFIKVKFQKKNRITEVSKGWISTYHLLTIHKLVYNLLRVNATYTQKYSPFIPHKSKLII